MKKGILPFEYNIPVFRKVKSDCRPRVFFEIGTENVKAA